MFKGERCFSLVLHDTLVIYSNCPGCWLPQWKWAWFRAKALRIVIKFFEQKEFVNNPATIAKYVKWATHGDGPSLYSIPTPKDCTLMPGKPGYTVSFHDLQIMHCILIHYPQPPIGPFESNFVKKIMTSFVRTLKRSLKTDKGFLYGALALTLIAVSTTSCITLTAFDSSWPTDWTCLLFISKWSQASNYTILIRELRARCGWLPWWIHHKNQ